MVIKDIQCMSILVQVMKASHKVADVNLERGSLENVRYVLTSLFRQHCISYVKHANKEQERH